MVETKEVPTLQCCGSEMIFSDPCPHADPTFHSDPDPDPVSDTTIIFSNILNINFTFVFPSYKCVRVNILTRYKLFRNFFYEKEFKCFN
jgi:hypothetical protein